MKSRRKRKRLEGRKISRRLMLKELMQTYGVSRTRSQIILGKSGRAGRFVKEDIIYGLQVSPS